MNSNNKANCKMDDNDSSKLTKNYHITNFVEPEKKKLCFYQPSNDYSNYYLIPQGMIWSNNSCAYDSIFTILFSIWCNNKNLWNYNFHEIIYPFIIALSHEFNNVANNLKKLETI